MNNRKRKKWLKQHGEYVNPSECWNLYHSIAEFILPRLKKFRKETICYPGRKGAETFEKWEEILDKMILAFQYIKNENSWWVDNPKYDYTDYIHCYTKPDPDNENMVKVDIQLDKCAEEIKRNHIAEEKRRRDAINEGITLFAKWYRYLWW